MKDISRIKSAEKVFKAINSKDEKYWQEYQAKASLDLFHEMAAKVPAYKKFLKVHGVNKAKIRTYADLANLPKLTKQDYLHGNSVEDIVWPGALDKGLLPVCATSGSTGLPTYLFRDQSFGWQFSLWLEYFIKLAKPGRTLVIDAFGLGLWMAGMLAYEAAYNAGLRGCNLSVIASGINKAEIFKALRMVAPMYDHVVMFGYPPFLKDVIDEAKGQGVDFSKIHLRLIMGGETFTESFRDYIIKEAKIRQPYLDIGDIYGCSEGGAVGLETPSCVFIKDLARKNPEVFARIFNHGTMVPTLAQYNPMCVMFEEFGEELYLSVNNTIPLLHYKVGDSGNVLSLAKIRQAFADSGINLDKAAVKAGIKLQSLPFVTVYERTDFSVSFYGLQIYPQTIKAALEDKVLLNHLTGKFAMGVTHDKKHNQTFEINLELKPGETTSPTLHKLAEKVIVRNLLEKNSEYRELARNLSQSKTVPHLVFWDYNDDKYFKSGTKQKWLKPVQSPLAQTKPLKVGKAK